MKKSTFKSNMKKPFEGLPRFGLIGLVLAMFLGACEMVVDLDLPDHDPVLVVNGSFQPDSAFAVKVLHSTTVSDTGAVKIVEDASVHILDGGTVVDTLDYASDGNYYSASGLKPVAGRPYTIRISAPGFETVEGTDAAPDTVPVTMLPFRDSVGTYGDSTNYGEVRFMLDDPGGENNYYYVEMYSVFVDTFSVPGDTFIYTFEIDIFAPDASMQATRVRQGYVFSDGLFNGDNREFGLQIESIDYYNGDVYLAIGMVSRNYFDYLRTFEAYQNTAFNPFAEPVLVHSNISSGMGIFAGRSVVWKKVP